jgi:hypothetical protein
MSAWAGERQRPQREVVVDTSLQEPGQAHFLEVVRDGIPSVALELQIQEVGCPLAEGLELAERSCGIVLLIARRGTRMGVADDEGLS